MKEKPGYIKFNNSPKDNTGSWSRKKPEIDIKKCIKCYMCWLNCPEAAIKVDKEGNVQIDKSICKGCGICDSLCPKKAICLKDQDE